VQSVDRYEKSEEFEGGCVDAMVEKDSIFFAIVVVLESWELTGLGGLATQWGVSIESHLLAKRLVVLLQRTLQIDECFEFVGEGREESLDLVQAVWRVLLVLPEERRLQDGHDFYLIIKLPFFYSTFFFIRL
jgi:hypothetical protein